MNRMTPIEAPQAAASIGQTRQQVAASLSQLVVGRQMQSAILSRLDDGTFIVKLDGATARMALPEGAKVGDNLALTFLGLKPRPTFLLELGKGNSTSTSAPASASASILTTATAISIKADSLEKLLLAAPAEEVNLPNSSASINLSHTAKLINTILQQAQQQGAATSLLGKAALIADSGELVNTDKLATQLQKSLSSSGLFYESHVAQWAAGKLSLVDLMREPQAQMAPLVLNKPATEAGSELTASAQMMHLQLDALEQQKIAWQGKLTPELPFQWEISRERHQAKQDEGEELDQTSWQSTLRFEFPHLGVVAATINMRAGHLQLLLKTNTADTVNTLQQNVVVLSDSLKRTGTPLDSFHVNQDEQA
jgi:hypothetical protein